MALYKTTEYVKVGKKWRPINVTEDVVSSSEGFWRQSRQNERRSGGGELTKISVSPTRTRTNRKVTRATTYWGNGTKTVRVLVRSSNYSKKRKK